MNRIAIVLTIKSWKSNLIWIYINNTFDSWIRVLVSKILKVEIKSRENWLSNRDSVLFDIYNVLFDTYYSFWYI